MPEKKIYEINGKSYTQKPLVIAQAEQIIKLLAGVVIEDLSPGGVIAALKEKLPGAAAIVLCPEGVKIKDKDLDSMEEEFAEELSFDTVLEVAEDFFTFNNLSSISGRFRNLVTMGGQLTTGKISSNDSLSNSAMET